MIGSFTTQRLHVSDWAAELSDPSARARLERSVAPLILPAVLEHLPPSVQDTEAGISAWIDARAASAHVMTVRAPRELIGLLFLADPDGGAPAPVFLGYMLAEHAWGQGYASELVQGVVAAWRSVQPARDLRGGVAIQNPASARVLVKAGFACVARTNELETYQLAL